MAFGITVGIVLLFTLFATQTRVDVTAWGGILALLLVVFCVLAVAWALVSIFVYVDRFTYNLAELAAASLGLLLFIFMLVYDTQLLLGGEHRYAVSPEDHVLGAVAIYLDIVNIFIMLLRIIAAAKDLDS